MSMEQGLIPFSKLMIASPLSSNLPSPVTSPSHSQKTSRPSTPLQRNPPQLTVDLLSTSASKLATSGPANEEKDLSFLLDPSNFHPLSSLDLAPPFKPLSSSIPMLQTLSDAMNQVETFLTECDFLSAAQLSAAILMSGMIAPVDTSNIFKLLGIRYSCLELIGQTAVAAIESKALLDLASPFYFHDVQPSEQKNEAGQSLDPPRQHIMPFSLRLQALRLQSIGFSDGRRGITSLYELGQEIREQIAFWSTSADFVEIRSLWINRLAEVGLLVANALVGMGDMDSARQVLRSLASTTTESDLSWAYRSALLYLGLGDLSAARSIIQNRNHQMEELRPFLIVGEGRLTEARDIWEEQLQLNAKQSRSDIMVEQNLAVTYLYCGQMSNAREILERLVERGFSFQSILLNLCTTYELCSDKSRDLKLSLARLVAEIQGSNAQTLAVRSSNADFKL